jgi:hypothetical protein
MKTSELTGAALDWAVAECQGIKLYPSKNKGWMTANYGEFNPRHGAPWYRPSSSWEQGGPIIEREGIALLPPELAEMPGYEGRGETLLIAAMRCYVTSKLGDEIEVPEDLNKEQA